MMMSRGLIRSSESTSWHKNPCTVSVKLSFARCPLFIFAHLNLNPSSHGAPPPPSPFSPRIPLLILPSLKRSPHPTLSFSNSISFNSEVQFSAGAPRNIWQIFIWCLQLSLIKQGKITLIETTFNQSDISTLYWLLWWLIPGPRRKVIK